MKCVTAAIFGIFLSAVSFSLPSPCEGLEDIPFSQYEPDPAEEMVIFHRLLTSEEQVRLYRVCVPEELHLRPK